MAPLQPLTIIGMPGSPYSRKLRAVLRYRRIPYAWVNTMSPESRALPRPKVELMPQLFLTGPDGALEARTDSTPLIRTLETLAAGRSVVPPDPVAACLDALLEDYADEWLTKAMFHYRWAFAADIAHAATILPRWARTTGPHDELEAFGHSFAERQIARRGVVGSNAVTALVIEESYHRLLALLDARLTESRFVMGARPGCADFALYGQLTQLAGFDPTPRAIALAQAPRVVAWVDVVEDLSGLDPQSTDWLDADNRPATIHALLAEVGRVYVPFLLANAAALDRGAALVECTIAGRAWTQKPFPYQRKCLAWLREGRATLATADQRRLDALIAGTGCEALFSAE